MKDNDWMFRKRETDEELLHRIKWLRPCEEKFIDGWLGTPRRGYYGTKYKGSGPIFLNRKRYRCVKHLFLCEGITSDKRQFKQNIMDGWTVTDAMRGMRISKGETN